MRTERLDPQDCAETPHKPVLIMVDYSVYCNAHMDGAKAMLDIFERSRKIVEKFGFIHSETLICGWLTLEQSKAPLLEGLFRQYVNLLIYEKSDNNDFSTFADDLYRTEIVAFMCVPYRHLASLFKVNYGTVPTKPYSKTLELLVSKMNSLLIHSRGNMSIGFVLRFLTYKERNFRTIYSDELSSIKYRHLCTAPAPFQQIKEVEDRMKKDKGIDNNATV